MLIRIENEPRSYAWGSLDALPELLGKTPTGEPQAELWLGMHPMSPAKLSTSSKSAATLTDLAGSDPVHRWSDQEGIPFLFKVLAIGSPLSLQVHPSREQAEQGFESETSRCIPIDSPNRNYRDPNHKPELLVALTPVVALSGFQSIAGTEQLLREFAGELNGSSAQVLLAAADMCSAQPERARQAIIEWAFEESSPVPDAMRDLAKTLSNSVTIGNVSKLRIRTLRRLCETYPGDPGILISFLLHVIELQPGEATYLAAGQLHSYQSGLAVEVMASSDNVLRAGFTSKHIDIEELCQITDFSELQTPYFPHESLGPGLIRWQPDVPDFCMYRATVASFSDDDGDTQDSNVPSAVVLPVNSPVVAFVTSGSIRFERSVDGVLEIARLTRGQGLYAGAGQHITIHGNGEAFIATVGQDPSVGDPI